MVFALADSRFTLSTPLGSTQPQGGSGGGVVGMVHVFFIRADALGFTVCLHVNSHCRKFKFPLLVSRRTIGASAVAGPGSVRAYPIFNDFGDWDAVRHLP